MLLVRAVPGGMLFSSGRRASGGSMRLVVVNNLFEDGTLTYCVIATGGFFGDPRRCDPRTVSYSIMNRTAIQKVRIYAGSIDPMNEARFVIPYEVDQTRGEIEGVLNLDDTVDLQVISGPCMMPKGYYERMKQQSSRPPDRSQWPRDKR
jgi:hypothetical protein